MWYVLRSKTLVYRFSALRLKSRQVKRVQWTSALDRNLWFTRPRTDISWWWDECYDEECASWCVTWCSALKWICRQRDTTWIKLFVTAGCHSGSDTVTCVGLRRHTRSPCIFHQETPKGRSTCIQETHLTRRETQDELALLYSNTFLMYAY